MEIVTGDRYLESLVKFVEKHAGGLIEGSLVLKLNPVGLHYVQSRLEALRELERLIAGAPVDYLRAYVSDLGDHRALEQLRRILCRLTSLKIVSVLPSPTRDPTPLPLLPFVRLKVLELRGCDLSTSAAKGLLELRHTLEKLICHNSTDALRHVLASRIADIKESPQWNRLSFVSCACNGLILMDESLQLLPAVETLDLSRNKFSKVDNLRKCTRLTHLDLGFNQLQSVASFSEVTCHVSKLVLRNNALTTLRGIETLKSIKELDVSYNIISNYLELDVLSSLPSLMNLWLEGNPLCCARWYRPQVFSFFNHPEKVKLDDKEMRKREFWKRQIIIARRQRRPASYGFYSRAKEDNEGEGLNGKRKKLSRLACIESEQHGMNMFFEHDSLSCDNEIHDGEENVLFDNEGEITSLINRIEFMKKERSELWLEDFKDWINKGSENWVDESKNNEAVLAFGKSHLAETSWRHIGESSRYSGHVSDAVIASGDDCSTNIVESNSSVTGSSVGNCGHQWLDSTAENGQINPGAIKMAPEEGHLKFYFPEGKKYLQMIDFNFAAACMNAQGSDNKNAGVSSSRLININSISESRSSSGPLGSPPHYRDDILYRRRYLEDEFLQLSAESFSAVSSDSDTSCDKDDEYGRRPPSPKIEQFVGEEVLARQISFSLLPLLVAKDGNRDYVPEGQQGGGSLDLCALHPIDRVDGPHNMLEMSGVDMSLVGNNEDLASCKKQNADNHEKKYKRKPKKRVVSLSEENSMCFCRDVLKDLRKMHTMSDSDCIGRASGKVNALSVHGDVGGVLAHTKHADSKADNHIEDYFNSFIADSAVHETCKQYTICNCVVDREPRGRERQVAVVLSNEQKMYVILYSGMFDRTGSSSLLTSHKVEDVSEVLVGLGLLMIRVYIDDDTAYLLITKSMEKTRHLLFMLRLISHGEANRCSIRSLDQVQVNLFDRHICGGLGISIYQYCMVLFCYNSNGGAEEWISRSLFVNGGHLFVCIEDFLHFSSLSEDAHAAPYFLLDSCCSIADVSDMVIEAKEKLCVTLTLKAGSTVRCLPSVIDKIKVKVGFQNGNTAARAKTWKLKWVSPESLCKFVTLLKTIHAGMSTSSLPTTYIS